MSSTNALPVFLSISTRRLGTGSFSLSLWSWYAASAYLIVPSSSSSTQDIGWNFEALRRSPPAVTSEKAPKSCTSRTVRSFCRFVAATHALLDERCFVLKFSAPHLHGHRYHLRFTSPSPRTCPRLMRLVYISKTVRKKVTHRLHRPILWTLPLWMA